MRYLDQLLGEATNFKKMQDLSKKKSRLSRKAAYREYQADSAAMAGASDEVVDRASDRKWSTIDKRADASNKLYKLKKKSYLKGGGKGDGKPKGKLRLVQSAFYQQVGNIIAEIRMRGYDQGTYDARHGAMKDLDTSDQAEAATKQAITMIKKLKLKPNHPIVNTAMATAELADKARERARKRVVRGSSPTPGEPGYKKRTKKGLPDNSSKN